MDVVLLAANLITGNRQKDHIQLTMSIPAMTRTESYGLKYVVAILCLGAIYQGVLLLNLSDGYNQCRPSGTSSPLELLAV